MTSNPCRLAVLVPMSFAVRNVVHSGVLARLHRGGARVDLILRRLPGEHDSLLSGAFEAASSARAMIAPSGRSERGRPLLNGIIGKAFSSRNDIGSYRLYRRWFGRELRGTGRLRADIIECAGFLARPKPLYRWLYQRSEDLYRRSRDLEPVRRQLCELRPDLVWSTVCSSPLEYPYVLAARDLKIPLVASILSFDNLTSRPALPLFDSYLVWNERMRNQLLSLYPEVSPESVSITGTTQFDFHRSEEFRWNRERTLRLLGLPPGARYFLYAASHESLAPEEPELVSALIRRLAEVSELRNHWLVVRLHPHDDGKRWAAITPAGARSRLAMAHERRPDPDGWAIPSAADQAQLVSSIAHCDACINIVSTMTLDAAVLDRPVVGIEFSREPASPQGIMFSEYEADHYKPVVESGGLRLARRWPELMGYLREAIENPERDREKRARLVRNECGVVDGHAADRITAALQGLLKSRGRFLQTDEKLSQIADREFSIA